MANIRAVKGSITRSFTQRQWDLMPKDKYGWKISTMAEAPPEVSAEKRVPLPEKVSITAPPEITKKEPVKAKAKTKKK